MVKSTRRLFVSSSFAGLALFFFAGCAASTGAPEEDEARGPDLGNNAAAADQCGDGSGFGDTGTAPPQAHHGGLSPLTLWDAQTCSSCCDAIGRTTYRVTGLFSSTCECAYKNNLCSGDSYWECNNSSGFGGGTYSIGTKHTW